jgi:hypothetical protein
MQASLSAAKCCSNGMLHHVLLKIKRFCKNESIVKVPIFTGFDVN